FFKQSRVFDGDHNLIGESRNEFDLSFGEWLDLRASEPDHPDRHPFAQQRNAEHAARSADPRIVLLGVLGIAPSVPNLDRTAFQRRASDHRSSAGRDSLLPLELFIGWRKA